MLARFVSRDRKLIGTPKAFAICSLVKPCSARLTMSERRTSRVFTSKGSVDARTWPWPPRVKRLCHSASIRSRSSGEITSRGETIAPGRWREIGACGR